MADNRYEREEYLEQTDDEREAARRNRSLIALAVVAALLIACVLLTGRLRDVSALQDCLMTKATNCGEIIAPR